VLRAWFTFLIGVGSGAPNRDDRERQRDDLVGPSSDRAGSDDALINWSIRIERSVPTRAHRGYGQHCPSAAGTGPHVREGASQRRPA
jgi:hypothetical protein